MPDLVQEREETQYVADFILNELGDDHSKAFYYLVAAKVPEHVVRKTLSEIRNDGARSPARVFAHRMKRYAEDRLIEKGSTTVLSSISALAHRKQVNADTSEVFSYNSHPL